jgi:hypothetical protein
LMLRAFIKIRRENLNLVKIPQKCRAIDTKTSGSFIFADHSTKSP